MVSIDLTSHVLPGDQLIKKDHHLMVGFLLLIATASIIGVSIWFMMKKTDQVKPIEDPLSIKKAEAVSILQKASPMNPEDAKKAALMLSTSKVVVTHEQTEAAAKQLRGN